VLGLRIGEQSGALTARGVQRRGLQLDALEVRHLGGQGSARRDLVQLAVAKGEHGLGDDRDDLGLRQHRGERIGLREQIVAHDEGHVVIPGRVHRRDVPAQLGLVDDVVVHERCGVHELE